MVRRGQPGVWISILVASLLLAIIAAAGTHLALSAQRTRWAAGRLPGLRSDLGLDIRQ